MFRTFHIAIVDLILSKRRFQALHSLWLYELTNESDSISMLRPVCTLSIAHRFQLRSFTIFLFLGVNCLNINMLHSKATMCPHLVGFQWILPFMRENWAFFLISKSLCRRFAFRILVGFRYCLCELFDLLLSCLGLTALFLPLCLNLHPLLIRHGHQLFLRVLLCCIIFFLFAFWNAHTRLCQLLLLVRAYFD